MLTTLTILATALAIMTTDAMFLRRLRCKFSHCWSEVPLAKADDEVFLCLRCGHQGKKNA